MWMNPIQTAKMPAWRSAITLGLVVLACVGTANAASVRAKAARTLNVTDEAQLSLARTAGEVLEEEGLATGALPGKVRVRFVVGTSIAGSFTVYPRSGGSITGHGSAQLHGTGINQSFGGTTTVSHGTGRYRHVHGSGGFYGTFNRRTHALVIQTTGRLSY